VIHLGESEVTSSMFAVFVELITEGMGIASEKGSGDSDDFAVS